MANHLPTDINPSNITIDNIETFHSNTKNIIFEIQDQDIPNLESQIEQLSSFYNKQTRIFSSSQPSTAEVGMAWFIQS